MRGGIDEVEEASTAIELGEKEGGISLGFGGLDPLKARSEGAILVTPFPKYSAPIAADLHF